MNRISVSFPHQYEQEYKHIQKIKKRTNISLYICELIRKDMQQDGTDLETRISRIVDSKLKGFRGNGHNGAAKKLDRVTTTVDDLKNAANVFEL